MMEVYEIEQGGAWRVRNFVYGFDWLNYESRTYSEGIAFANSMDTAISRIRYADGRIVKI